MANRYVIYPTNNTPSNPAECRWRLEHDGMTIITSEYFDNEAEARANISSVKKFGGKYTKIEVKESHREIK